tara:strand:+ start:34 stop:186 length:153 start_codon:yes stop_codon:yes gene_type:complete
LDNLKFTYLLDQELLVCNVFPQFNLEMLITSSLAVAEEGLEQELAEARAE